MNAERDVSCHDCLHLVSNPDGVGGGTYFCALRTGLVVGEYGHWCDESDEPHLLGCTCKEPNP